MDYCHILGSTRKQDTASLSVQDPGAANFYSRILTVGNTCKLCQSQIDTNDSNDIRIS